MTDSIETEPLPPCVICESWPEETKFSEHHLFELVQITNEHKALIAWLLNFAANDTTIKEEVITICEVHFPKDEITREYDENGLPLLKISNELVVPTFLTYEECLINNEIGGYLEFLTHYHRSLNTINWNMEATDDEVTFMLKNFEIIIRVKSSMHTIVKDGSNILEQGSILQTHLNNGKIENWSNLRSLMLFCEENSPLTEVMVRLGSTIVLEETENDMFTSLDDVLCFVKTILDDSWFYDVQLEANYIIAYQIECDSPRISKAIKIHPDFSMTGYVDGQIIGTKSRGTIRFLSQMNKEEVQTFVVDDENDDVNWNIQAIDRENKDHICSFEYLSEKIATVIPHEWQTIIAGNTLILFKNNMKAIPQIQFAIKFNKNLNCSVYINETKIDMNMILPSFEETILTLSTLGNMIQSLSDCFIEETVLEEGEIAPIHVTPEINNSELVIGLVRTEPPDYHNNSEVNSSMDSGQKRPHDLEEDIPGSKIVKIPCFGTNSANDPDVEVIPLDDPLHIEVPHIPPDSGDILKCAECGEIKATQNALLRHMIKHKTEFRCQLCSEKFNTPKDLRQHMDSVHVVTDRFECPNCQQYFLLKADLDVHVAEQHQTNNFYVITEVDENQANKPRLVCEFCSTTFLHKSSLNRHMKNLHNQSISNGSIIAEETNDQEIQIQVLQSYESTSSPEMASQIIIDPDGFVEEGEIILGGNSEIDSMSLSADDANCTDIELICDENFDDSVGTNEQEIQIQEMPSKDGFWACTLCPYKGKSRKNLLQHCLYHKSKNQCGICLRYYPSQFLLNRHLGTHGAKWTLQSS